MLAETGRRLKGPLASNAGGSGGMSRGSPVATEHFFGLEPGSALMASRSAGVLAVDMLRQGLPLTKVVVALFASKVLDKASGISGRSST